MYKTTQ